MYNNAYEEYIRSVLGYPNNSTQDLFQDSNNYNDYMQNNYEENRNLELEDCYPEIYKIVYPMVKKACQEVRGEVTKDDIDKMVDELYSNIEGNSQVDVNKQETRYFNGKKVIEEPKKTNAKTVENRQFNRGLSDIIRILLLRELLGRPGWQCGPGRPCNRPPFPPPPPGRPYIF